MKTAEMFGIGLAAFAGGIVTMGFLDPRAGGARRSWVRQKLVRAGHEIEDAAHVVSRDITNRGQGIAARLRPHGRETTDRVLVERVRSKLGRVCSHPRAIEVSAREGCVELRGPILAAEKARVLAAIAKVKGVAEIDDDLDVHETADIPSLQGGEERYQVPDVLQRRWAPATRVLAFGGGLALAACGVAKGGTFGLGLGLFGTALIARSVIGTMPRIDDDVEYEIEIGDDVGFDEESGTLGGGVNMNATSGVDMNATSGMDMNATSGVDTNATGANTNANMNPIGGAVNTPMSDGGRPSNEQLGGVGADGDRLSI